MSVPGVGPITALTFTAAIEDPFVALSCSPAAASNAPTSSSTGMASAPVACTSSPKTRAHRALGTERDLSPEASRIILTHTNAEVRELNVAARASLREVEGLGEQAWPPLAMFKALLLSVWYDLSDVKLAEALDDRVSIPPLLRHRSDA